MDCYEKRKEIEENQMQYNKEYLKKWDKYREKK